MLRISEKVGEDSVHVRVEGVLDNESVSLLSDVCSRHLETSERIILNLGGLLDISREGVEFLRKSDPRVLIVDAPEFVMLSMRGPCIT
jgi:hypothetical protein